MRFDSVTLAAVAGGTVAGPVALFSGVSIDSRSVADGDLFVALKGERHDGHDFLAQALEKASGALVSRPVPPGSVPPGATLVRVPDTLAALRALSRYVRDALRPRVVGVTGSVGKTTTKELTAALAATRYRVAKTSGNLNNTIGLPLEVARMDEDAEVLVAEMGMSTPGEIRLLSELVRPDVGVVTAVAPVHLAGFASLDGIEAAKAEILSGMGRASVFVANADDPRSLSIAARHTGPVLRYGLSGATGLDATASGLVAEGTGTSFVLRLRGETARVSLPLPGRHNVSNFLAAAAAASALGVGAEDAARAAPRLLPARHRGQVRALAGGGLLYDDSYNSSPVALAAAFAAFETAAGARRKVAVVGEMLELGPLSRQLHAEAGREIGRRADLLVAVRGDAEALAGGAVAAGAPPASVLFAADAEAAEAAVRERLSPGDALFVKGSRGVGLDRLVDALLPEAAP